MARPKSQPETCTAPECDRPTSARNLCKMHYKRAYQPDRTGAGFNPKGTCTVDGCDKPHKSRGMCNMHWMRWYRTQIEDTCDVTGCDQPVNSRGWCSTHYSQWRRTGDPLGSVQETSAAPTEVPAELSAFLAARRNRMNRPQRRIA